MAGVADPVLSVVVTVVSDTTGETDTRHLEGCLNALARQQNPPSMEIIVTCDGRLRGVEELQSRFPTVRFLRVAELRTGGAGAGREHHDELRGIGLRAAKGSILAMLEDHGQPAPDWCARVMEGHQAPHAAVGGAMENGINRVLNWAVFFSDFGRYQNPVARGVSPWLTDANVSYKRSALEKVDHVWKDAYNETLIHRAFHEAGETLWITPDIVVYQHRLDLRWGAALRERYVWGRSYSATRMAGASLPPRLMRAALAPLLPAILVMRHLSNVLQKKRSQGAFFRSLPALILLSVAWSWGELMGYLTGRVSGK